MKISTRSCSCPITAPENVAELFEAILKGEHEADRDKEHLWTIGLTTRNTVKYIDLTSLGTLSASFVHPREVFRFAIMQGVHSLIVVHNHPSGDAEPSDDDITTTKRLIEAGKVIGIEVLDHVIVTSTGTGYTSMKAKGRM